MKDRLVQHGDQGPALLEDGNKAAELGKGQFSRLAKSLHAENLESGELLQQFFRRKNGY
jgi:hypothetical protein